MTRLIALCLVFVCAAVSAAEEWTPLLDESLSKWEVFTGVPEKSVDVPEELNYSRNPNGKGPSIGLGDPMQIYSTMEVDGELVLNVTGEVYAGLTSLEEYSDYHFSLEYRWRDKKWPPRLQSKRDSGLLLHCVGKHGSFWKVWMSSLECQIQEGDTGDFIPLAGTGAKIRATKKGNGRPRWDPEAPFYPRGGQVAHGPSQESPHGEWNTVEVFTVGDRMVFVVNGKPNMALVNTQYKGERLDRGKIQIQSEAAEIQYRNIKIRPLAEFPDELATLVVPPEE